MATCIFLRPLVTLSLYAIFNSLRKHLILKKSAFLSLTMQSISMIHRHNKNIEMTRELIRFIFDPRDVLLSLQIGFRFVRAAVACAIFGRISDLELSSQNTSKVPEACYSSQLLPFYTDLTLDVICAVCNQFVGLLGTDFHPISCAVLSRLSTRASSSCSSSARASMLSANRRLVIFLPPMLTFPSCSSRAIDMIRSRKIIEEGG